jgi:uncharacterized membrane protein HdeD (DUF308 family)
VTREVVSVKPTQVADVAILGGAACVVAGTYLLTNLGWALVVAGALGLAAGALLAWTAPRERTP